MQLLRFRTIRQASRHLTAQAPSPDRSPERGGFVRTTERAGASAPVEGGVSPADGGGAGWVGLHPLAILLAGALLALAAPLASPQDAIRLRAADVQEAGYPTVRGMEAMAERLYRETAGRIRMKIYPGAQLGDERDMLEMAIFGGIDISRTSIAPLNSIAPETSVYSLPFLFRSTEHMRRVLDGPIGDEVLAALEPHGLIGLAYYDAGARSMYNRLRPIHSPADIRGMKVRVMNSEVFVDMISTLGGNATPMGFGQVYESLALGTVEAAENNWPSYESSRHFEVAPYYSVIQHVMVPEVLLMSRYRWRKLSPEDRALLRRAARASVPVMRELWDARVKSSRNAMVAAGVEVVDNIDKQPFMDAMRPLYDQYLKDPALKDLVESIRAAP